MVPLLNVIPEVGFVETLGAVRQWSRMLSSPRANDSVYFQLFLCGMKERTARVCQFRDGVVVKRENLKRVSWFTEPVGGVEERDDREELRIGRSKRASVTASERMV